MFTEFHILHILCAQIFLQSSSTAECFLYIDEEWEKLQKITILELQNTMSRRIDEIYDKTLFPSFELYYVLSFSSLQFSIVLHPYLDLTNF